MSETIKDLAEMSKLLTNAFDDVMLYSKEIKEFKFEPVKDALIKIIEIWALHEKSGK